MGHRQEENRALRADAKSIVEGQHAELLASEGRAQRLQEELHEMQALLGDLKGALEATLEQSARSAAAAAAGHLVQAELELELKLCR